MKTKFKSLAVAAVIAGLSGPGLVQADERAAMESLRITTLALIDALVEQGVLTRDKADALVREADRKAARALASRGGAGTAGATVASGTVRVPYVPDSVKNEMREQIKQEVIAQAKTERWAEPNAVPEWLDRIQLEGDIRVRYQRDYQSDRNTPPTDYAQGVADGVSRWPDMAAQDANGNFQRTTVDDRSRWRLRARLGANVLVSESVSGGLRIATGNSSDRVSTNQTLGDGFNKYAIWLDRAWMRWRPVGWFSLSAGRMPNPWFSSDLVWDEDLNFDGMAVHFITPERFGSLRPFLTAGYFPLRDTNPPKVEEDRAIAALQAGLSWDVKSDLRVRFAGAYYDFGNLEGRSERNENLFFNGTAWVPAIPSYGSSAYESTWRQKGNTLVRLNAPLDATAPIWGLASRFKPVALTAAVDFSYFEPIRVLLSGEYVDNTAYKRDETLARTGFELDDVSTHGYQFRLQVGHASLKNPGDWHLVWGYRRLGSDAVPDAFTDSDYLLGGTNHKGWFGRLGYAIDRGTSVEIRWNSFDSISTMSYCGVITTTAPCVSDGQYSVDSVQLDLNMRF